MRNPKSLVVALAFIATGTPLRCGCTQQARAWVSRKDHREIAVEATPALIATTRNGTITAFGEAKQDHIVLDADVSGGGVDQADAQAALNAIVLTMERKEERIVIDWHWKTDAQPKWQSRVHYEIHLPAGLEVELSTRNGNVVAKELTGPAKLETRNGQIVATTTGPRLEAHTANGNLDITTAAADVVLKTSNGTITAALQAAGEVSGELTTSNGSIVVTFGPEAATLLDCSTSLGRILCNHNLGAPSISKKHLKGSLRGGKKKLDIKTSNGSIRIQ